MIKLENLTLSFGKKNLFENVSFEIPEGEIVLCMGKNGVGKTTLLKCILGLQQFDKGSLYVAGESLKEVSLQNRARHMAYVPQSLSISSPLAVRELLEMSFSLNILEKKKDNKYIETKIREISRDLNIEGIIESRFEILSGGEKQKVLFAAACLQESKVILLDEVFSSIDLCYSFQLISSIKSLRSKGISFFLISHDPRHAILLGDKFLLMSDSGCELVNGSDENLFSKISDCLDVDINLLEKDNIKAIHYAEKK